MQKKTCDFCKQDVETLKMLKVEHQFNGRHEACIPCYAFLMSSVDYLKGVHDRLLGLGIKEVFETYANRWSPP